MSETLNVLELFAGVGGSELDSSILMPTYSKRNGQTNGSLLENHKMLLKYMTTDSQIVKISTGI